MTTNPEDIPLQPYLVEGRPSGDTHMIRVISARPLLRCTLEEAALAASNQHSAVECGRFFDDDHKRNWLHIVRAILERLHPEVIESERVKALEAELECVKIQRDGLVEAARKLEAELAHLKAQQSPDPAPQPARTLEQVKAEIEAQARRCDESMRHVNKFGSSYRIVDYHQRRAREIRALLTLANLLEERDALEAK